MNRKKYNKRLRKTIALLVSLILIVSVAVGATLAFIIDKSETPENVFTASEVTTLVEETTSGGTKSEVKVKNTGDVEAYIRAAVVVTWQDANGNVYGESPVKGTDYSISFGNAWTKSSDGFYYYTSPVKSDDEDPDNCCTDTLITSCSIQSGADIPEGYSLNVEILSSGIQSVPKNAVTDAWSSGVSAVSSTGTLAIKQ